MFLIDTSNYPGSVGIYHSTSTQPFGVSSHTLTASVVYFERVVITHHDYMVMAYCWPMHFHLSMSPTKPLYVNETGLLLGMGKLNDFSSYMYCIGTLVNVY